MMLTLKRWGSTPWGTFGTLFVPNLGPMTTLEPPWADNSPNVSCIPDGLYDLEWNEESERWQLEDVPGRWAIQIHVGNTVIETEGCILVGRSHAVIGQHPGIRHSRGAMEALNAELVREDEPRIWIEWQDYRWGPLL